MSNSALLLEQQIRSRGALRPSFAHSPAFAEASAGEPPLEGRMERQEAHPG
jgi:hypothetical protein